MIGLDVSSSAVKLLELGDMGKGLYRVERYGYAPLPKDAIPDGAIAKPEVVEAALRDAWRKLGTRTREVVMSLPTPAVITKKILIPKNISEAEIETQLAAEANQLVALPIEEVSLDYQVLGQNTRNPEDQDALLVVTRKERVEERVALAESVGLKPSVMDVDIYASIAAYEQMAHQLPDDGQAQTVALIDIGAQTTFVNVLHDNQPVYQREHALGGSTLTGDIARRFDMSTEEAEEAKRRGALPESYEAEVLQPFMEMVVQEINRAVQLFFSATPYHKIDHIILAGGCSAIPGLDDLVHRRLQTNTLVANPFTKMSISPEVKARQLAADAPSLMVACGLALRRFDPI
jgi:type IV pilus assembly protein PilM